MADQKNMTLRLSAVQADELEAVARAEGISVSDAVRDAAEAAGPGDQVLLSPGFSSFDQFRNYEDRGDQFERLVRERRHTAHVR